MKLKLYRSLIALCIVFTLAMPLLSPLMAYGEGAKPTAAELIPEQIPLDAETLLDSGRVREASTTAWAKTANRSPYIPLRPRPKLSKNGQDDSGLLRRNSPFIHLQEE